MLHTKAVLSLKTDPLQCSLHSHSLTLIPSERSWAACVLNALERALLLLAGGRLVPGHVPEQGAAAAQAPARHRGLVPPQRARHQRGRQPWLPGLAALTGLSLALASRARGGSGDAHANLRPLSEPP